jgi:hypothetical protein
MMKEIARQLQNIVQEHTSLLQQVNEETYEFKPAPNKWSKNEILGHLVDSAQNNIRRFIVAQYEDAPKIVYKQDSWVAISNYQSYPAEDLIALWQLLNNHAAIILSNTDQKASQKTCDTNGAEIHSIEWLARDYIKHLLHHLHQILDLAPVPYP